MLPHTQSHPQVRRQPRSPLVQRGALAALLFLGLSTGQATAAPVSASENNAVPVASPTSDDPVARGHYLAIAGDCAACHTAQGGRPYAGGLGIETPLGKIYASNITPSTTDGIGDYSEEDFARALRKGISPDHGHLYPAMPYTSYAEMTDKDVSDLYTYFMKAVAPVDQKAPETELSFPFSMRGLMAGWNMLYRPSHPFKAIKSRSAEWNRGAYLAQSLAHCSTCHTPRNGLMAEKQSAALAGASLGNWYAPNITSSKVAGIGNWSKAQIVSYLKTGHADGAQAGGPMAEAVNHSFQHLTDSDLNALASWLKTVPANSAGAPANRKSRFDQGGDTAATEAMYRGTSKGDDGYLVYSGSCESCHQADGLGRAPYYPALAHNSATGGSTPDNLISAVVFGIDLHEGQTHHAMPGFGPSADFADQLTTQQIADVSNYVLKSYGNPDLKVTLADVKRIETGDTPTPTIVKWAPVMVFVGIVVLLIIILVIAALILRAVRGPRSA